MVVREQGYPRADAVAVETGQRETRRLNSLTTVAPLALLVALLDQVGRPIGAVWPQRHLDVSWMTGLQLARERGLRHGSDIVFTYGPWGFLDAPTSIDLGDLWLAAGFRALAVASLLVALHACMPAGPWRPWRAAAVALVIANSTSPGWVLMLATCAGVLALLMRSRPPGTWLVIAMSSISALLLQVKFSEGLLPIAMIGLLVLVSRRPAQAVVAVVAFVVSFLVFWLAASQSVADVPRWLRLSFELVGGYGEAMAYLRNDVLTWLMLVGLVVAAAAVVMSQSLTGAAKVAVLGMLLFLSKAALTRADASHLVPGYAGIVVVLVVVLHPSARSWIRVLAGAVVALTMSLMALYPTARDVAPGAWPPDAWPSERVRVEKLAKQALIEDLDIAPAVLAELQGHPVSIDPWEISAAWAYDLDWHPLPIFQRYSAYTPRLDELNAEVLLVNPELRVLREREVAVLGNPVWETPAYTFALLCNFEEVVGEGEWSVFARADQRCGPERTVTRQRTSAGQVVDLPAPDESLIAVRFTADPRPVPTRILAFTGMQLHLLHANVDDERYPVTESIAAGPLVVAAPGTEPVLGPSAHRSIAFDRAGVLEIVEIPLTGRESE